jgi:hypothetical protein
MNQHVQETLKAGGDAAALAGTISIVAGLLPPIAAFVTIIWTLLRIWEMKTVQRLLGREPN